VKVIYINECWNNQYELATNLEETITFWEKKGYKFRDIKISSSGNGTLILFEKCIRR